MPYAQEPELAKQLKNNLCDQIVGIRQRRLTVEQNWLRSHRAYMGLHLDSRYTGDKRSMYNIPAARRAAERTIVRAVKLVTPNVKWFEISPMGNVPQTKLSNVDNFMRYILNKRIKSRANISQLMRCLLLYGMCILKTSIKVSNGQAWPYQRPIDPFSWYMYPETSPTIAEAEIVFEDFLLSYNKYQSMFVKPGRVFEDVKPSELGRADWPYHLTERLAYQGITDPTANVNIHVEQVTDKLNKSSHGFLAMTEIWVPREDSLYQGYIVWNTEKGARLTGFFKSAYDAPLYQAAIHRALPNETYTNSQMDDIVALDNVQNDLFNEFIDAVDWEKGIAAFGSNAGGRREQLQMKGKAKWDLGSDSIHEALQFIQTPVTSTNTLRAFQIATSMLQSMGGSGTIAEGQPGRNMPRAGNAVNNLINLGMADIQDMAEILEQEVLTPSLGDIYKVSTAFIPDSQLMRIPGGIALYGSNQSNILKKQDILGDFEFEWIGSQQFQDQAQRAQQLMIFLNMSPMLEQLLGKQGYSLNIPELVQMIWRYGLGERGLDKVIIPMQQPQQQPGMPQANPQQEQDTIKGIPGLNVNVPTATNGYITR